MRRKTGSGSGRRVAGSTTEARRIQRGLARVEAEAQRSMQEAMKSRDEGWLEHMRQAVVRVEAAAADLFASVAGLTRREVEVYRLESAGYGVAEISRRLMIQRETVRTHLKHLHSKLVVVGLRAPDARTREYVRAQPREGDEGATRAPLRLTARADR